jgi:hypothetical protein
MARVCWACGPATTSACHFNQCPFCHERVRPDYNESCTCLHTHLSRLDETPQNLMFFQLRRAADQGRLTDTWIPPCPADPAEFETRAAEWCDFVAGELRTSQFYRWRVNWPVPRLCRDTILAHWRASLLPPPPAFMLE